MLVKDKIATIEKDKPLDLALLAMQGEFSTLKTKIEEEYLKLETDVPVEIFAKFGTLKESISFLIDHILTSADPSIFMRGYTANTIKLLSEGIITIEFD